MTKTDISDDIHDGIFLDTVPRKTWNTKESSKQTLVDDATYQAAKALK
jgi:hypothetical protein